MPDVLRNERPGAPFRAFQNDDGGSAVHIVIAVDQNFLFSVDRRAQALDGLVHSSEQKWIVQMFDRWRQKSLRGIGVS